MRIGISGWRYPPWRGVFYPADLAHREELAYASRQVASIELNGSFYSLQRPEYYAQWHDETPDDFVFSVKGPRFITHVKRLRDAATPLANFFASGVLRLRAKLGPFLWQLPPTFKFEETVLDEFCALLPRTTADAAKLARRRDARMRGRASLAVDDDRPLRHALEVRHETFRDPAFVKLARRHRVAIVVADTAGRWPLIEDVTSDFLYLRLHGDEVLYTSGYTKAALDRWAARIAAWRDGGEPADAARIIARAAPKRRTRDVFCYFDNDVKVHAPDDARALMARLGVRAAR